MTVAERAGAQDSKLRFVLFAAEQKRRPSETRPYVFEDDLFAFIWKFFRPAAPRCGCDVGYQNMWGTQFERMVGFFKDPSRDEAGTIGELYGWMQASDGAKLM
jgi:hypothetical protein